MNQFQEGFHRLGVFTPHTYGIWVDASLSAINTTYDALEAGELSGELLIQHLTLQHELDHYKTFISTAIGFFFEQVNGAMLDYFGPLAELARSCGALSLPRPLIPYLEREAHALESRALTDTVSGHLFNLHVQTRKLPVLRMDSPKKTGRWLPTASPAGTCSIRCSVISSRRNTSRARN